jgi:hypothetical protein
MIFIAPHARIVLSALTAHSGSANSGNPAVWIAGAALIVSVALPLYLDGRQRPRVRVRISTLLVISGEDERRYYEVSAINHGRSAVTINRMDLIFWTKAQRIDVNVGLPQQKFPHGENLPKPLNPYSNISFGVLQNDVHQAIGKLDDVRLCGSLSLSNGFKVFSRRTLRLDAKSKPPNQSLRMAHLRRRIFARERISS